jgi:predicted ATPase/signal transduction histidine kinase
LARDLDRCERSLAEHGTVAPFSLAEWDPSPRPEPPARLLGRDDIVAELRRAPSRASSGSPGLVVLHGESGAGKSSVVAAAFAPSSTTATLVEGKLDAVAREAPYGGFVQACHTLVKLVLGEGSAETARWKARLHEADPDAAPVLAEIIPDVALLVGEQPSPAPAEPSERRYRLERAFSAFFGASARAERPLVVFLDDLDRADPGTLTLLAWLLVEGRPPHTTFVAAWRDEGEPTLRAFLDGLRDAGTPVERLPVPALDLDDTAAFVGAILAPSCSDLPGLARIVRDKTGGNPQFVLEFVRRLYESRVLTLDAASGEWHVELLRVREAAATDNIRDLLTLRIRAIPGETRALLSVAACLGHEFDAETLVALQDDKLQAAADLLVLTREGFLVDLGSAGPSGPHRYRFVHDHVQEAAHALLSEEERAHAHLAIGRYYSARHRADASNDDVYRAGSQLNAGLAAVSDAEERAAIGRLNLRAGERAFAAAAFEDAFVYLSKAVELVGSADRDADERRAAHLGLARCGYLCGHADASEEHFGRALEAAVTPLQRAEIYAAMAPFHTQQGRGARALSACLEGLRSIGVRVPAQPGSVRVLRRASQILWRVWRLGQRGLSRLPPMSDPERRMAMQLLMNACLPGITLVRPTLVALLALEMMDITLRYGVTGESGFAYVVLAMFGARLGLTKRAHAMGKLALDVVEGSANPSVKSWVWMFFAGFVGHLQGHLADSISLFEKGYGLCLRAGEQLQGSMILDGMISLMPSTGHSIATLHERASDGIRLGCSLRRAQTLAGARAVLRWTHALAGLAHPPAEAAEKEILAAQEDAAWQLTLVGELLNVQAQYLLGRYTDAGLSARTTLRRPYVLRVSTCYREFFVFYHALTMAALAEEIGSSRRARRVLAKAARFLERVAARSPANGVHRQLLVSAELARLEGRREAAAKRYSEAIAAAAANAFPHEEALANELAGRFHLRLGESQVALRHLRTAREGYAAWGAAQKVAQLDAELAPATRESKPETLAVAALDLDSVIRSSRAISGEIVLERLIERLMSIVVENAGAEKGYLLLEREGRLTLEAEAIIGRRPSTLSSAPAEGDPRLPWSIISYVCRTTESLVLNDASAESSFRLDPYVARTRPKSVLAAPLLNQGKLVALIYMENNLHAGAFTADRLQVVTLLLAQSALSLHNAALYESVQSSNTRLEEYNRTLEANVEERTRELQRMQKHLFVQEKLASLGTITAGIAHELRNPLNFINNFAELSAELTDELAECLGSRSVLLPAQDRQRVGDIVSALQEDIARIRDHGNRASGIIGSMLMHARSSSAAREEIDLAAVVTQSVSLAIEGARAQMPGLDVRVEQQHEGAMGPVSVRVQDIQRVVLNLVNNACHAVWRKRQQRGTAFQPTLTVVTRRLGDDVELRIRDNGVGIPRDLIGRLFTPFLTTKAPGEGTGLGLSLSHDIIVQGHGGDLRLESVPGEHTEAVIRLPRDGGRGEERGGRSPSRLL